MKFNELRALKKSLEEIESLQVASLERYYDRESGGFFHRLDQQSPGSFGKSSTATCVLSLLATQQWQTGPWAEKTEQLAESMLRSKWKTGGLPENNVFTTAFVLETYVTLRGASGEDPGRHDRVGERVEEADSILNKALEEGAAQLKGYPKSAYLTQLAARVLLTRDTLPKEVGQRILEWARREIDHQLALLVAGSKTADFFQLAYSIVLVSQLEEPSKAQPDQKLIQVAALEKLFEHQLPDGSWPRSQPLFHYTGVGNAYCYEYEMLTQLLRQPALEQHLLPYLPNLFKCAMATRPLAYELGDGQLGWASGHHPQFKGPESWSTACVFHFVHQLDRLLAEAFRRSLFDELGAKYTPPIDPDLTREFGSKFLDCEIDVAGERQSLKGILFSMLVEPIAKETNQVKAGRALQKSTPMSVILFGPPGTSKTELSRLIAEYLGWPRLVIDPSHFVREGMDMVQAQADRIFAMLTLSERVVVLLDEFDEMVRERADAPELISRLLTTGMLPRLAAINRSRRIVFIVATNFIDNFDLAISRRGRFDLILQVMPPSLDEKLNKWPQFPDALDRYGVSRDDDHVTKTQDLTFDEFAELAGKAVSVTNKEALIRLIGDTLEHCTLNSMVPGPGGGDGETWKELCEKQRERIRTA